MDLHRVVLGNTVETWLHSGALAILVWVAFWLARKTAVKYLARIAEKHRNPFYDTLSDLANSTKLLFLLIISLSLALRPLTLPAGAARSLDRTLVVALVIQVGLWGGAFLRLWIEPYMSRHLGARTGQDTTIAAVSFLLRLVFFSLLLIWGLDNLGVNVSALVAGLGVGGVAVALATQNVLGDLFASLSITLDKPFEMGDSIMVGTFSGFIEKIGLKTTRLRSDNGEQLVFSNADLLNSRIQNTTRMKQRRTVMPIGVTYDTAPEKLRKIPQLLEQATQNRDKVRFDRGYLKSYGPSSLDYEFVFWTEEYPKGERHEEQHEVLIRVIELFNAEGIEFAFPTQTVVLAGDKTN